MEATAFTHPVTHTPLVREGESYRCVRTGETFPDQEGRPCFLPLERRAHAEEERSGDLENRVKTWLRLSPRLYVFLIWLISPVCYVGMTAQKFLKRFSAEARIINVGSGVHRYRRTILNLDTFPYREVDVVGDATQMPFTDNTFDGALCECLIEHVPEPKRVVAEVLRVLKPGGEAFFTAPFVYPFHACPHDYYRWSSMGMRELFRNAEIVEIASRSGPTSALTAQLVTWLAITFSFGSEKLYKILAMVLLIPIAPFKFLDKLIGRLPTAHHGTEGCYAIVRKRMHP